MIHIIKQHQFLPISIEQGWAFFSNPSNLNKITPDDMKFKIRTELSEKIYSGMMIRYSISPFLNLYFDWLTEITQVNEPNFFVDEQRCGPYKLWHHEHHLKEVSNGIEVTDIVHYQLPFGWIGNLFHRHFIKPKLIQIFNYRKNKLEKLFF